MSNRGKNLSTFFLILSFVLFFVGTSEANFTGTIGARFNLEGSGFGIKKPTVYIEYEKKPGLIKKVNAKVEKWSDTSLTCIWTSVVPPGTYNLFAKPAVKGIEPIKMGTFRIMNPVIDDVVPNSGVIGDIITVNGRFFTTKKPTVYLEDAASLKRKKCKVLSSMMNQETGVSTLQFVIPKWGVNNNSIILTNGIGKAAVRFPYIGNSMTISGTVLFPGISPAALKRIFF